MAATYVECIAIAEGVCFAVNADCAPRTDVKDAKFAALIEESRAELIGARELQGLCQRHCGANDGAVKVDIDKLDGTRS
jgi:hypothetical protein